MDATAAFFLGWLGGALWGLLVVFLGWLFYRWHARKKAERSPGSGIWLPPAGVNKIRLTDSSRIAEMRKENSK